MKKRSLIILLAAALTLLLVGCFCDHEWLTASCTAPKTCQLCHKTEGEALGHTWQEADCTTAKTCSVCKATDGDSLGHSWKDADCTTPKTCTACSITEGDALGHAWEEATTEAPETCSVCSATQGAKLVVDPRFTTASTKFLHGTWTAELNMTREMMGLTSGFENGFDCVMTMEFSRTGELYSRISLKDESAFMVEMKAYTIKTLYDNMKDQGFSKEETDRFVKETYGMTVEAYVESQLKVLDMNALFKSFEFKECYYVQGDQIFTGTSWAGTFTGSKYTFKDGILTIEGVTAEDGGAPLKWAKQETL